MCGIAGIVNRSLDKEELHALTCRLLVNTQSRGTDASGIAYRDLDTESIRVVKAPIPAEYFTQYIPFVKTAFAKKDNIIIHCRATTAGSQLENVNNHPHYSKEGIALIHNGIVTGKRSTKRFAFDSECDSEIILRAIESRHRKRDMANSIRKAVKQFWGSFAIAVLTDKDPDAITVAVDSIMPLTIRINKRYIAFASTPAILKKSFCKGEKVTCAPCSIYRITKEGVEIKGTFPDSVYTTYNDDFGYVNPYSAKTPYNEDVITSKEQDGVHVSKHFDSVLQDGFNMLSDDDDNDVKGRVEIR